MPDSTHSDLAVYATKFVELTSTVLPTHPHLIHDNAGAGYLKYISIQILYLDQTNIFPFQFIQCSSFHQKSNYYSTSNL